jgi:hypothetical protein
MLCRSLASVSTSRKLWYWPAKLRHRKPPPGGVGQGGKFSADPSRIKRAIVLKSDEVGHRSPMSLMANADDAA